MYNETNSVKDLTEAYESLKEVVMKEASWDAMKEMSQFEFQAMTICMKLADASMQLIKEQDELLRETYKKVNQLEELLQKIDSKIERPV